MPPDESAAAPDCRTSAGPSSIGSRGAASARPDGMPAIPGRVLARRLSNAEFDYTIRDLTGVDIRPTREFPVDPANEAGFDNSGESLAMSPALVEEVPGGGAAGRRPPGPEARRLRLRPAPGGHRHRPRQVLRPAHHRLLPSGIRSTTPITSWPPGGTSTARRSASREATLGDFAAEAGLSAQVSRHDLGGTDRKPAPGRGPLGRGAGDLARAAGRRRRSRPTSGAAASGCATRHPPAAGASCRACANLQVKGISDGSQPFVLWRNRQLAEQRMRYPGGRQGPTAARP